MRGATDLVGTGRTRIAGTGKASGTQMGITTPMNASICFFPRRARRAALQLALGAVLWRAATGLAADLPEVVPLDGPSFRGLLHSATPAGQCEFANPDRVQSLSMDDLVSFGAALEPRRGSLAVLADGSLIVGEVLGVREESLVLDNDDLGELVIPLELTAGVLFRLPALARRRDTLIDRALFSLGHADRLLMENGDELEGRFRALESRVVRFDAQVGPLESPVDGVAAILFDPSLAADRPPSSQYVRVGLRDGSLLNCTAMTQTDLLATLQVAGCLPWQVERRAVAYLAPHGRRVLYLSELEPTGYRHVPFLDLTWNYRLDRAVGGAWLRASGRWHPRGIGMHSASRLTFPLPAGVRRFDALAALDDEAGAAGSVVFRVFVDSEQRFASPVLRGGDPPAAVAVDCAEGKSLSLVVDFADRGDQLDHADWLDARLVK